MRDYVLLHINGQPHEIRGGAAFGSLSDYLRYGIAQIGTKVVCAEGDCGACTVLLGRARDGAIDYRIVNSCIQYVYQLDGAHIVTVEGLRRDEQLTPVQEAMVCNHGSQCGFCTPGFVVAMTSLCERQTNPTSQSVQEGLIGNLCRCTGYLPILLAGVAAKQEGYPKLRDLYPTSQLAPTMQQAAREAVQISAGGKTFFKPTTLEQAAAFKRDHPTAMVIAGGTDLGVRMNKGMIEPSVVMSLSGIAGLDRIEVKDGRVSAGALATWTAWEDFARDQLPELHRMMLLFGSPQIRNAGTIGGNIANASPIADSLPFLYVMEAELELMGTAGTRRVRIDQFYKGYKQLDLRADELIATVSIPLPRPGDILKLYKVSKRKHMDISSFTAGIWARVEGNSIQSIRIAYGGVAPVVLRLPKTEAFLVGQSMTEELMHQAGKMAAGEIAPISDVRGSKAYRSRLGENILLKFFHDTARPELAAV
jgi:xanthine dehydrogenase small subunit